MKMLLNVGREGEREDKTEEERERRGGRNAEWREGEKEGGVATVIQLTRGPSIHLSGRQSLIANQGFP